MVCFLTFEEHGVDEHGSVRVGRVFGDLGQFAVGGGGGPLVDGVHRALLVLQVDLGVVVVVALLAVFHKGVGKADGAGAVQAVADFPGGVSCLGIAHLKRSTHHTPHTHTVIHMHKL